MASSKSRGNSSRGALEPRRRPGKERVAALMDAAALVIAERGFESATMAEIAARAGALVGSLYHFFPNKASLADALIQRYVQMINDGFSRIQMHATSMSNDSLADALVYFLVEIQGESKAMRALLETRAEFLAKRDELREAALEQITRTLVLCSPSLTADKARHVAVIILQNMKTMKQLINDPGPATELRDMTRIYLANRLEARPASFE